MNLEQLWSININRSIRILAMLQQYIKHCEELSEGVNFLRETFHPVGSQFCKLRMFINENNNSDTGNVETNFQS